MNPLSSLDDAGSILDDLPEYEPTRGKFVRMRGTRRDYTKPLRRRGRPIPESACYCATCVASRPISAAFLAQERRILRRGPVPR